MPNIFDQFDTPSVAPQGTNPFDAFDGNFFDQFGNALPPKFANLPGGIKLDPLQQVQLQSLSAGKGIDPENAGATIANLLRGTDDVFLQSVAPPIVAAAHTLTDNPLTRKIGFGLNFAGQAIKGDVESALFSLVGQNELANQQLIATAASMDPAWKQKDESLGIDTSDPYEDARETLPVAERMVSGIGPGLLQSAPQLALAAVQPELGAASFGFTPQGFDPVQAAAMMIAPAAGKLVGGIAGQLAAKAGISDAQALDVINRLGGGAGVAGLISAPTAWQIAQMKSGPERDEAIQDVASNAILTGILGARGASTEMPDVEKTPRPPNVVPAPISSEINVRQPPEKPISQKLDDLTAAVGDIKAALTANQILPNVSEAPTVESADAISADRTSANTGKVRIQNPNGNILYIPQERLQAALNAGYRIPPTPIPQKIDDLTATVRSLQAAIKGNQLASSARSSDPVPVETTAYKTPSGETQQPPPAFAAAVVRGVNEQAPERPSFSEQAERLAQNLESLKTGIGNGSQLHAFGIAADLWDRAVAVAQHFIRGGGTVADAIDHTIAYVKRNFKGAFDERGARAALARSLVLADNARLESEGAPKVVSAPGQAQRALLDKGLGDIWPGPEAQKAWRYVLSNLAPKELTAVFRRRKAQSLATDSPTIHEEAAIARVINAHGNDRVVRTFHNALRAALEKRLGINLPATAHPQLQQAVIQLLRNRSMQGKGTAGLTKVDPAKAKPLRNVLWFKGFEIRAVRNLSHLKLGTLRAMTRRGFAGRTKHGKDIVLHHLAQNPAGPLVEMPEANNNVQNRIQHPFGNTRGAGLTEGERIAHGAWRNEYWRWRAKRELDIRRHLGQ